MTRVIPALLHVAGTAWVVLHVVEVAELRVKGVEEWLVSREEDKVAGAVVDLCCHTPGQRSRLKLELCVRRSLVVQWLEDLIACKTRSRM